MFNIILPPEKALAKSIKAKNKNKQKQIGEQIKTINDEIKNSVQQGKTAVIVYASYYLGHLGIFDEAAEVFEQKGYRVEKHYRPFNDGLDRIKINWEQ